jgi:HEAT repeat protein
MGSSFLAAIFFAVSSFLSTGAVAAGTEEENLDIRVLKDAGLGTDDAALLQLLGHAARSGSDAERIDALIKQLGDESFDKREDASDRLSSVGAAALPGLRIALKDPDLEIAKRARTCIEKIEKTSTGLPLAPAAARLLVLRHPDGTAEALLEYLPYAMDTAVAEEILFGLDALAVQDVKVRSALTAALKDSLPARRAASGCILGRLGDRGQRAAVSKLFDDADAMVRLRAAQGSLAAGDKSALPILIALLDRPETDIAWQAEELLHWAAADDSPEEVVGAGSPKEQESCQVAWQSWWRDHGPKLDLKVREKDPRRPGLVMVCGTTEGGKQARGNVILLGCDGTTRWKLDRPESPADAVFIPGNRLLMLVERERTVTERDLSGKKVESPISTPSQLDTPQQWFLRPSLIFELNDANGKANGSYKVVLHDLQFADQTVDGRLASVDSLGKVQVVDPQSMPEAVFLGQDPYARYGLEALRDGHFLITDTYRNRVRELDGAGNLLWEKRFNSPLQALRLLNGGMLLMSETEGGAWMIETNSARETVWRVPVVLRPTRARVCFQAVRLGFDRQRDAAFDTTMAAVRLRAMKSKDVFVRRRAAVDMGTLGRKSPEAIAALIEAIKDPDPKVRQAALISLQWLGPRAKSSVPALIEALSGPKDPDCGHLAQYALWNIGPGALPELVKALKHGSPNTRAEATWVLAWLGKEDPSCFPALIDALKDDDPKVRAGAIWALGKVSPWCVDVVPTLAKAIDDKDADVRLDATVELFSLELSRNGRVDISPALARLLKAAKDKDWKVRAFALRALGAAGPKDPAIVPALLEGLKDRDYHVVFAAADGIARIGPDANVPVATLLDILQAKNVRDEDQGGGSTHEYALDALEQIGPKAAKEAVPVLIRMLRKEKNAEFQPHRSVAMTLGGMGPAAKDAIPALVEETRNYTIRELPSSTQAHYCDGLIQALVAIGTDGLDALLSGGLTDQGDARLAEAMNPMGATPSEADGAVFSYLLKKGGKQSVCAAAERLGFLGPKAKDAVPALRDALKSDNPAIRLAAARALAHIGVSEARVTAILLDNLKASEEPREKMRTVSALGSTGSAAKVIVPALLEQLDPPADPRAANRRYLLGLPGYRLEMEIDYRLDGYERRVIRADRLDGDVEACIVVTLGRIGPDAKAAIPALARRLQDPDADFAHRCLAAEALGKMGAAAKAAVPDLVKVLKDEENDAVVQAYAAEALGNIGPDAKEAVALLKDASVQRATIVRRAAATALKSIQP